MEWETSLLENAASFASCTRTELDLLSFIGTEVGVAPGIVVMEQHAMSRDCLVISAGRARIERDGECLGSMGPGEFFGELSLLTGATHPYTVTAETEMELFVLSPADFDSLLANAPSVVRKMLRERRRGVA